MLGPSLSHPVLHRRHGAPLLAPLSLLPYPFVALTSIKHIMFPLPAELLRFIVAELATHDPSTPSSSALANLRALRLANRALSGAATPLLFRTVRLRCSRRSAERLLAISRAPHLAPLVDEVAFVSQYPEEALGEEEEGTLCGTVVRSDTDDSEASRTAVTLSPSACSQSGAKKIMGAQSSDAHARGNARQAEAAGLSSQVEVKTAAETEAEDEDCSPEGPRNLSEAAESEVEYHAINGSLTAAFGQLYNLTSLRILRLSFDPDFDEDEWLLADPPDPSASLPPQLALLRVLSASPRPPALASLHLTNLIAFAHDTLYLSPSFRLLLAPLRVLEIRVRMAHVYAEGRGTFAEDSGADFWETAVPRGILAPPVRSLTSLTLHNDHYLAVCFGGDGVDVEPVETESTHDGADADNTASSVPLFYPCLESLSFGHILLSDVHRAPAHGLEAFVLRHARTLRDLELFDCPIFVRAPAPIHGPGPGAGGTQQITWAAVFTHFRTSLPRLISFSVMPEPAAAPSSRSAPGSEEEEQEEEEEEEEEEGRTDSGVGAYVCVDPAVGWGYVPYVGRVPGAEEDARALERLRETVETRRWAETGL